MCVIKDVQDVAGSVQLRAGQTAGVEAAVHAMGKIFENNDTDAVLLVDASNAINSLNRAVALHNISILCPSLGTIAVNTYRAAGNVFIDGETLYSYEGTTQGDPLAMAIYAIGILPLIHKLPESVNQVWFADDATASSRLQDLLLWRNNLIAMGPSYGYFPNSVSHGLLLSLTLKSKQEIYSAVPM